MINVVCGLDHHSHDSIPISISLLVHYMELCAEESPINCVFRTGVDVELEGFVGPIHSRDLERILGATSSIVYLDSIFTDGECQVSNSAGAVL